MKKILLIAVLIGAMFSVSAYVVCIAAPLLGKSIKGSGNIVSKNIEAPDFNAVDASRAVKVIISAEASDIRIEADDNLIDLVIAKAKGKTLEVTLDQKANNLQNASITVTVPANGGNIRSLKASSASKIELEGSTESLSADLSSASKLDAAKLTAVNAAVSASSASKAEIACSGQLTAEASSGSSIRYTGDCRTSLSKSSGGSIRKN